MKLPYFPWGNDDLGRIPNWGEPLFTFPGHPCLPSRAYKVLFPQEEFQIFS